MNVLNIKLEELLLYIKKLVDRIKQPCPKCPYALAQVHTLINPCPQCKSEGYQMFERFKKEQTGNSLSV